MADQGTGADTQGIAETLFQMPADCPSMKDSNASISRGETAC